MIARQVVDILGGGQGGRELSTTRVSSLYKTVAHGLARGRTHCVDVAKENTHLRFIDTHRPMTSHRDDALRSAGITHAQATAGVDGAHSPPSEGGVMASGLPPLDRDEFAHFLWSFRRSGTSKCAMFRVRQGDPKN